MLPAANPTIMLQKRKRSASPDKDAHQSALFRSSKIEDRQSTFIGLFSPSIPPKDLQNLGEIKSASHKILAWRRESNQQSLTSAKQYVTGHDDDGEKYGGKKVEQVLVNGRVIGACVVARWYGGVMLGRVRFDHMEACALEAVKKWQDSVEEEKLKRRKLVEESSERVRIVNVLSARDQSITVLRALALENEENLKGVQAEALSDGGNKPQYQSHSPAKVPQYDGMPLARLQALERARDATISFLLKRIDRAEAETKAFEKGRPEK